MGREIYIITEYHTPNKVFYTHKKFTFDNEPEIKYRGEEIASATGLVNGEKTVLPYHKLDKLSLKPKGMPYEENVFLPFVCDIKEDLPTSVKFKPKVYKNCKLMSEKHGGYLQFFHEETKEVLRIAINSNTFA